MAQYLSLLNLTCTTGVPSGIETPVTMITGQATPGRIHYDLYPHTLQFPGPANLESTVGAAHLFVGIQEEALPDTAQSL